MVALAKDSPQAAQSSDLIYWKRRAWQERQRADQAEYLLKTSQPFIAWENELFASKALDPAEKLLLRHRWIKEHTSPAEELDDGFKAWRYDLEEDATAIGVDSSTVSRRTKRLVTNNLVSRIEVPYTTKDGRETTLLYGQVAEILARPAELVSEALPSPKKHGGNRYECQHCLQPYKRVRRRVVVSAICENPDCPHCGIEKVITDETTTINQQVESAKEVEATCFSTDLPENSFFARRNRQEQDSQQKIEPATSEQVERAKEVEATCFLAADEYTPEKGIALYLQIGGDRGHHIVMARSGNAKYITVPRPLGANDIKSHMRGGQACGAACSYGNGETRALAWDVDDADGYHLLREAALRLVDAGYQPLIEGSPAGRGGHLWIVFDGLVQAEAARVAALQIAPELATVKEYWPAPVRQTGKQQNVRLPGAYYARLDVRGWCLVNSVLDGEMSIDGETAARLVYEHQTPAGLVPPLPDRHDDESEKQLASLTNKYKELQVATHEKQIAPPVAAILNNPEEFKRQSRVWFNATHQLEDIQPLESNGYALATWRGERTASVRYYLDTNTWADFGGAATKRGGDALELSILVSGREKREALRDLGRAFRAELEARRGLDQAQVSREKPAEQRDECTPAHQVQETPTAIADQAEQLTETSNDVTTREQAEETNETRVAGLSALKQPETLFPVEESTRPMLTTYDGPIPPPARTCIKCGESAWHWNPSLLDGQGNYECVCQQKKGNSHAA